jgi:golgi phosphoprotein 3
MTSQGLSRRRVANASGSSSSFTDISGSTSSNVSTNTSPSGTPTVGHSHAGSAFKGGSKVAFDPRDLDMTEEDARGGKMPKLTIMEEVLLLGLKDKQASRLFVVHSTRVCLLFDVGIRSISDKDPPPVLCLERATGLTVQLLGLFIVLE